MMASALIALAFGAARSLEMSLVQSFPLPYAVMPVMLIAGIIVLHRVDLVLGIAWLVMMSVLADPWGEGATTVVPFLAAAVAAVPLEQRIFANRSVYALLGMGLSLQFVVVLTAVIMAAAHGLWSDTALFGHGFLTARIYETIMLLLGLYGGAAAFWRLSQWARRTFFLHA